MAIRICAECIEKYIPEENWFTAIANRGAFLFPCWLCGEITHDYDLPTNFPEPENVPYWEHWDYYGTPRKDKTPLDKRISFVQNFCKNYYDIKRWKATDLEGYQKTKRENMKIFNRLRGYNQKRRII